jgi:membrane-associated phospholipid phosphatase
MSLADSEMTEGKQVRNKKPRAWVALGVLVFIAALIPTLGAQTSGDQPPAAPQPQAPAKPILAELPPVDLKSLPRNLFVDQKNFWTTPFRMTVSQWQWTVPIAFIGAGLIASDTAIEEHVPTNPTTVSHAVTASNAGVGALVGIGGGLFVWGHLTHNDQQRETGILSGEAAIDAFLETEAFKYATGRDRPFTGNGKGQFFQGGVSFPSEHASVSFAIASVIAHEYPGPATQILVYSLAGAVSAARFVGHQHFASDVVVGSALGWYTGRQVFRSHSHYSDAEIARWGTFSKKDDMDNERDPSDMGSPYIPLDSWIYPAMERMIARGYVKSAFLGMRPWTRMECARLLEAGNKERSQNDIDIDADAEKINAALQAEFKDETARLSGAANLGIYLDSVYTRFMGISGAPLHDGLHFGQTIINDYGRPYGEGFNNITGFSGHALLGPLTFYARTEYQHAPMIAALPVTATLEIQAADGLPAAPPSVPIPAQNHLNLLEGYVGMMLNNWQFSFGKQELWWGADRSGPMLFSNNAEPIVMLHINRVKPYRLPILGDIRLDYIVGRLTDYHWVYAASTGFTGSWTQNLSNQPFIVGEKISLQPFPNLEVGISATALFGGPGVPVTTHKLFQAMFSTGNGAPGSSGDPGDRRGGFDFTYRIPQINLSFYGDAFTDDEPNPWLAWNKTALTSGLYFSQLPGLSKLSLRMEGVYTDPPGGGTTIQHGFFYSNDRFKSGYTNNGNLIGSWIGREGQGADAWVTYSLNPKSKIEVNFRHQKVSPQFITYGGTLTDFGISGEYALTSDWGLSAWVQHERWLFPIIQPSPSNNVTTAVQIQFEPHKWSKHASTSTSDH